MVAFAAIAKKSFNINSVKTKRILLLIPFLIAIATIVRCWIEIATSDTAAQWRHYSAVLFVVVTVYFYFKSFIHAVISVGVFLLLGTLNVFSMTSHVETTWVGIAGLKTPPFNALSLGLLFLYFVLNFATLVNLYLDEKERKFALRKQKSNDNAESDKHIQQD
jgi:hypothetical protein